MQQISLESDFDMRFISGPPKGRFDFCYTYNSIFPHVKFIHFFTCKNCTHWDPTFSGSRFPDEIKVQGYLSIAELISDRIEDPPALLL